ncbi:hypothetical protein RRG08_008660 [Elysia crispata]|uniref:Sulfotransferase domain-containing protein n=1 Tax=Elysia crispata TaxID=231223 RepID=A0AAE0XXJ9_9GAST|nr:hypothetical protein RRG08_008660 [Elysia crispata]
MQGIRRPVEAFASMDFLKMKQVNILRLISSTLPKSFVATKQKVEMSSESEVVHQDCSLTKAGKDDITSDQKTGWTENQETAILSRTNPYCFPERSLFKGLTYNGVPVTNFPVSVDPITHVKRVIAVPMRSDDVIVVAFPKCGTHWMFEILHMLFRGTTHYATQPKEVNMLEFIEDLSVLDQMTSPRVLNSHLYTALLPEQVVEKKVKLVHLIRNPKDCVVSYYYHVRQYATEKLTFDNFIKGYITEGYTSMSHQFDYLRQMSEFEKAHTDHPILHIHFEDLKRDSAQVIQELAQFLGIATTLKFCQDVATACGFEKLRQADISVKRDLPKNINKAFPKGFSFYRKGMVGDWKNTFTVAQNEMFDLFMARQEKKGLLYQFRWDL